MPTTGHSNPKNLADSANWRIQWPDWQLSSNWRLISQLANIRIWRFGQPIADPVQKKLVDSVDWQSNSPIGNCLPIGGKFVNWQTSEFGALASQLPIQLSNPACNESVPGVEMTPPHLVTLALLRLSVHVRISVILG